MNLVEALFCRNCDFLECREGNFVKTWQMEEVFQVRETRGYGCGFLQKGRSCALVIFYITK